jgi:hypothetical protein
MTLKVYGSSADENVVPASFVCVPTFTPVKKTDLLQVHLKYLLAAHDWHCDEKEKFVNSKSKFV